MDNTYLTIFVSFVTIWALFGDDIRILAVGKGGDNAFYIMTLICFAIFSLEILLSCYAKGDYLFTFFFWLDLVSTVTLLLDVGWISDALYGTSSDSAGGSQNSAQIAKAAKASQVGTRAARVIRIIRLIRLIRIVKLYKAAEKERLKKENEEKAQKKKQRAERKRMAKKAELAAQPESKDQGSDAQNAIELKSVSNEHMDRHNESDEGPVPGIVSDRRKLSESGDLHEAQLQSKGGKNAVMPISASKEKDSSKSESKMMNASKGAGSSTDAADDADIKIDEDDIQEQVKESNVGKELISNITKIVIVLILMIMFSVALFTSDTYLNDEYDGQRSMLRQLER